jgi:hypothetical protein
MVLAVFVGPEEGKEKTRADEDDASRAGESYEGVNRTEISEHVGHGLVSENNYSEHPRNPEAEVEEVCDDFFHD